MRKKIEEEGVLKPLTSILKEPSTSNFLLEKVSFQLAHPYVHTNVILKLLICIFDKKSMNTGCVHPFSNF